MQLICKNTEMSRKFLPVLGFGVLLVVGLFFISKKSNTSHPTKNTTVTTSFYPLFFFAKKIAGDTVSITNILPAGSEPHDYEPTAQDIATIAGSKLLLLQGSTMESWGHKMID